MFPILKPHYESQSFMKGMEGKGSGLQSFNVMMVTPGHHEHNNQHISGTTGYLEDKD